MRRAHRTVHRVLWPILVVAVGIGVAMALTLRPAPGHAILQPIATVAAP